MAHFWWFRGRWKWASEESTIIVAVYSRALGINLVFFFFPDVPEARLPTKAATYRKLTAFSFYRCPNPIFVCNSKADARRALTVVPLGTLRGPLLSKDARMSARVEFPPIDEHTVKATWLFPAPNPLKLHGAEPQTGRPCRNGNVQGSERTTFS